VARPISVTIPHQLGRAEAHRRIDEGFSDLTRHLGAAAGALDRRWHGDRLDFSLTAMGQAILGHVAVAESEVIVEVILPGLLALVAGRVQGTLRKEGQLLLTRK
jgi:hypothetical protein